MGMDNKKYDNVNSPLHYQSTKGIEAIDVIEAFTDGLNGIEAVDTANAIKYICRWKNKNGIEDLHKAIWYITHLINHLEDKKDAYICDDLNKKQEALEDIFRPSEQ